MNHHGRWRIGAMASAIALLGSLASLEAHAVALGRVTVQSALGEALRAEIDISDLSAEEVSSLRVGVAGAEVFKSAGLEYTAAAAGLEVKLQRRPDGRSYLRLSSNRAVTDPFVDLVLEAKWASGRVTRDYTMLFDPPGLRASSAAAAPLASPVLPQAPVQNPGLASRDIAPMPPYSRPAARPVAAARPEAARVLPAQKMPAGARQVTVKPGDNASRIASQNKPASVSLDQMLVALLRANPAAFAGGNINVIKSGAVLDIPDEQAANALSPGEARQTLVAQSANFNAFRRKLADGVPAVQQDNASRQAGGKVQASVDDRSQTSTSPDKLTLSKGAVQGKPASEQLARETGSPAADTSNSIGNLNKPGAVPVAGAPTAAPGLAAPAPGGMPGATPAAGASVIAAAPALPAASALANGANAPGAATDAAQMPLASSSGPVPAASEPTAVTPAVVKRPVVVPPPPPEPGLMEQILDHSLLLGGGALLALLAGLGFARYRKNKKDGHVDSSFLDSRLQPDSFFGASGGRRVDTSASKVGGSSMAYAPSQLDAAGDVDPVAEADVYLAYGRDQQAEEILKEALRTYPARLAIHTKLLEIYAKRRDNKAFESMALTAFKLSKGEGTEWAYISQLGRELEPSNSLYQPHAEPSGSLPVARRSGLIPLEVIPPQNSQAIAPVVKAAPAAMDLDLDLDFSLDEARAAPITPVAIQPPAPARSTASARPGGSAMPSAMMNLDDLDLDLDLDLGNIAPTPSRTSSLPATAAPLSTKGPSSEIDFLSEGLDFTPEPYTPPKAAITHEGMMEFDLNSLSLDLDPAPMPAVSGLMGLQEDPLEIKFLLAEEFRILGDSEGARSLADEVMTKAKGPLRAKAQAFLNSL